MTTAATNVADTTNAAPAAPAAPSKMDLCKPLFSGLKDGSIALIEGKSARATFISKAVDDLGLTKNGAATYWQNLTSLDKGGKLYPHTAAKKKTDATTPADAAPADEAKDPADDQEPAKDLDDVSHLEG